MSKHLSLPTSRLLCAGGAKARTNAFGGWEIDEEYPLEPYNVV